MSLTDGEVTRLAHELDDAQTSARPVTGRSAHGDWDVPSAYRVQRCLLSRRRSRGEQPVGLKLGFTSRAKMRQMGVHDVIVGQLTDAMDIPDGGELSLDRLIHPRVEPEVAFRIARDVDLEDPRASLATAVDAVAPALEIIDSRYRDFRFSYADVIADNTSAAAFVIGSWAPVRPLDNLAVRMTIGPRTVSVGTTGAILGDPIRGLRLLTAICRRHAIPVHAGDVVLAGAATAAVPITEGFVTAQVADLGRASVRVTRGRKGGDTP
ncbi:2-keto-4-pentenoate hydratase [Nonomuraea roseoviolacea]|uniref:2-oxo-3-hexenedioate decarboxylase n=1 Tax=Nonomuraea roseoviolacea subsp. carminata TaxID=160689 RepID=A0ABT1JVB7_9ACTN|nr:4-oxalocrotonate decarboxylase [Nonomuraea roseoviolacea]MCP2345650.1 2-oxo-3-hexenedioate decarboxylase [Nonomuraea roseoviolacea subsp. carminata]